MDLDVTVIPAVTAALATTAAKDDDTTAPFNIEATFQVVTGSGLSKSVQVSGQNIRLALILIMTVLTIAGNSFAVFVINFKKQDFTSGKLSEVRLVTSLFFSDLLLGLTAMSMASISGFRPDVAKMPGFPELQIFFINWCGCCSVYNMAAVSFVKMLAVTRPFQFEQQVTSKRCWVGVTAIWLVSFVISVPVLTDFVHSYYSEYLLIANMEKGNVVNRVIFAVLVYIPATTVIFISYWKIFMIIVKHKTQISETSVVPGSSSNQYQSAIAAIKSAKKMLVIIGVYFIVFTPLLIIVVSGDVSNPETQGKWHVFIITWVSLGNSCYNCMLYIAMHKRNRAVARQVLFCQEGGDDDSSASTNGQWCWGRMDRYLQGMNISEMPWEEKLNRILKRVCFLIVWKICVIRFLKKCNQSQFVKAVHVITSRLSY